MNIQKMSLERIHKSGCGFSLYSNLMVGGSEMCWLHKWSEEVLEVVF